MYILKLSLIPQFWVCSETVIFRTATSTHVTAHLSAEVTTNDSMSLEKTPYCYSKCFKATKNIRAIHLSGFQFYYKVCWTPYNATILTSSNNAFPRVFSLTQITNATQNRPQSALCWKCFYTKNYHLSDLKLEIENGMGNRRKSENLATSVLTRYSQHLSFK